MAMHLRRLPFADKAMYRAQPTVFHVVPQRLAGNRVYELGAEHEQQSRVDRPAGLPHPQCRRRRHERAAPRQRR